VHGDLPQSRTLIRSCDVRGLLHSHTRYADGAHSLRRMVETARDLGLEYLGVSDHLKSSRHPEGMNADEEREQRLEIAELQREFPDFHVLHGMEADADDDGDVDLPDGVRDHLDYLMVAMPGPNGHGREDYTESVLRLIRNPLVDIVSRPLGSYMLTHCRLAADLGVTLAINPNAHRAARLVDYRQGVAIARDMGLSCRQFVNTLTAAELRARFARGGNGNGAR
jgi:DNA polymerase (family 10)